MNLGDLLDSRVLDENGHRLGYIIDARFLVDHSSDDDPGTATLDSFVVSPRTRTSFMGYERSTVTAPIFIAHFLRWRHRGSRLLQWRDVARVDPGEVRMRRGYRSEELTDQLDE